MSEQITEGSNDLNKQFDSRFRGFFLDEKVTLTFYFLNNAYRWTRLRMSTRQGDWMTQTVNTLQMLVRPIFCKNPIAFIPSGRTQLTTPCLGSRLFRWSMMTHSPQPHTWPMRSHWWTPQSYRASRSKRKRTSNSILLSLMKRNFWVTKQTPPWTCTGEVKGLWRRAIRLACTHKGPTSSVSYY